MGTDRARGAKITILGNCNYYKRYLESFLFQKTNINITMTDCKCDLEVCVCVCVCVCVIRNLISTEEAQTKLNQM